MRKSLVRHAVIGLGGFGLEHARATESSRHAELVAVVDKDAETRAQVVATYPSQQFADLDSFLSSGVAESVSVALPHALKDDVARRCLEAGLHVYVEKPLALRGATARQLVELAEKAAVQFAVGHQYRTFRGYKTIKHLLESGSIGDVHHVLWTWHQFRSDAYFARTPWLDDWALSGGGLLSLQLAHDLDVLSWLFGPARAVSAHVTEMLHHRGVEDSVSAIVEFENGGVATLQASINRPGVHVVRQIVGDRGMIVVPSAASMTTDQYDEVLLGRFEDPLSAAVHYSDGHRQPAVKWTKVALKPADGQMTTWMRPRPLWRRLKWTRPRRGLGATLDSYFRAIRGGGPPLVEARSAVAGVDLREAILASAAQGIRVELPIPATDAERAADDIQARLSRGASSAPGGGRSREV